jgi:hypothetical protein
MIYQPPQPKMPLARWRLLDALMRSGAPLEETITMTVEGVPCSISPVIAEAVRGPAPRQQISYTYGSNTNTVLRIDLALQRILADAIRARPPAPVGLDELEPRRLAGLMADVDKAVVAYRDLLRRRTGVAWSVRVGSGKYRSTITVASEPKSRVPRPASLSDSALDRDAAWMTPRDCAVLAALTGRTIINPANGLQVGNHTSDRLAVASAFAGVELLAEQRRFG